MSDDCVRPDVCLTIASQPCLGPSAQALEAFTPGATCSSVPFPLEGHKPVCTVGCPHFVAENVVARLEQR